jgi:hypothetical protein
MSASTIEDAGNNPYALYSIQHNIPLNNKYNIYSRINSSNDEAVEMTASEVFNHIKKNKIGHEGLFGGVKPYFDFDFTYKTKAEQVKNECTDALACIYSVESFLKCMPTSLTFFCANGKKTSTSKSGKSKIEWVNSFHIIYKYNNMTYPCGADLKADMLKHKWKTGKEPDFNVYATAGKRQLYRLPYCSKAGEDRPLVRFSVHTQAERLILLGIDTFDGNIEEWLVSVHSTPAVATVKVPVAITAETQNYMDYFKSKIPEAGSFIFKSITDKHNCKIVNLTRTEPSNCSLCKKTHDNDNTGLLIAYNDGNIFYSCIKKPADIKQINIHSVKITGRERMIQTIKARSAKKAMVNYEKSIKDGFVDIGLPVQTINVPFCADSEPFMDSMRTGTHGIVGIRSDMGTGKTFANKQVVEELLLKRKADYDIAFKIYKAKNEDKTRTEQVGEPPKRPNLKILVISMRTALASKYKQEYKGSTCYLDKDAKQMLTEDFLICQLDSLNRVRWSRPEGQNHTADMVVIDEATQALKHLVSTTYMKNPNVKNNVAKLKQLIAGAKQIVLMDANLDADTVQRVREIKGATSSIVFWNEHKGQQRNMIMTDTKNDVIRLTKNNLNKGDKSYIACNNSCESILTTRDLLKKYKPDAKILAICTDTLHLKEVKDALEDPNKTWGLYDVVICSPSVQSGVSYDVRGVFDSIYGMFSNLTNSSGDACQMLHRVRHPNSNDIIVSYEHSHTYANHNGGGITNRSEYIRHLTRVRNFGGFEKMNDGEQSKFNTLGNMTEFEYNQFNETEFKHNWYFNMFVDFNIAQNKDKRDFFINFIDKQLLYGGTVSMLDDTDTTKANEAVKETYKLTKDLRKENHAIALDEAVAIDKTTAEDIKKKMHTINSEITEDEQLQYKKYALNSIYKMDMTAEGSNWYETLDNNKMMNQFNNLSAFTNNSTLQECLTVVKDKETQTEIARRQEVRDEQTGAMGAVATETAIINSLVDSSKYKSVKFEMMVSWIELLGFKSLHDDTVISAESLTQQLECIHRSYFADARDMCSILGKNKRSMATIEKLKTTDPKFTFSMLKIINSVLDSTWGLKIAGVAGKTKRKDKPTQYRLINENVAMGIFKNPLVKVEELEFKEFTPVLGYHDTIVEETVDSADSIDTAPNTDELMELLKMMQGEMSA